MSNCGFTRREFCGLLAAVAAGPPFAHAAGPAGGPANGMTYRVLGRTDQTVSAIGLGGAHIGTQEREQDSISIIRTAIDSGITFMDNSWDYNKGASEERMGKALKGGLREKVFLMTKIDGRDRKTAEKQLNESLSRLKTDRIDLLQFHEIIRMSDPDRVFAPGGALEAAISARQAGKVRFIGFTGHKSPEIHLRMIETARTNGFTFDTVQMPLNVMDAHFDSFEKKVLPVALKLGMGVLGMKPMGDHFILDTNAVTAVECLRYAMNLPTSVVITGCDSIPILQQAVSAASAFKPMSAEEVRAMLAKTAESARGGKYELYKTSHHFDSTYKNPQYLG